MNHTKQSSVPDKAQRTSPHRIRQRGPKNQHHHSGCTVSQKPNYLDRCLSVLTQSGLRLTAPRKEVISFFASNHGPVTIAQLHASIARARRDRTPLSKVSLYRVIADLEQIHLIHQVHPSGGFILCAHIGCAEHSHIIISCQRCEDTRESTVPAEYLGPLLFFLKNAGERLPEYPILRLEGLCRKCEHPESVPPTIKGQQNKNGDN